jgi:Protein of unknown function (DUF2892)
MKSNVGNTDRIVRLVLAVLIAAVGFYFKSWWGLVAIVPLLTALSSFCPVYKIFGLNTCSTKSVQ